jgi:hypothetical protein
VEIETQSSATLKIQVLENNITGGTSSFNSALHLRSGVTTSATLSATVVQNTIANPNTGTNDGRFKAETSSAGAGNMCLDLRNNVLESASKVFELVDGSTGAFARNHSGNTGTVSEIGTFTSIGSCTLPTV